ncbi:hypothetical protein AGMMS49965_09540 [Bacteroidia bacterium]|nr:hypothetical protein AGMMS49965_09540 [Bacteroidia bacterium]
MLATKTKREASVFEESVFNEIEILHSGYAEQPEEEDWFDAMPEYWQQRLLDSLAQADAGLTVPHSEVRKRYEKWL